MVTAAHVQAKQKTKGENPLDAQMTPAQIARRKFKSSLPRKVPNKSMSKLGALSATMDLIDRFRNELHAQKLDPNTMQAALVYHWPDPEGKLIRLETAAVPAVEKIGTFVEKIAALNDPQFLGVLFSQEDPKLKVGNPYKVVAFVAQFVGGPEAEGLLMIARERQLKGLQTR
jgi:hypothetical protein